MSKENCKKNELPKAITDFKDEPVYKYVEPIAAVVDEEWLRMVSLHYPMPYLLRHYWQKVVALFLQHVCEVGAAETVAYMYDRKLKRPKKNSLDWLVKRIKDRDSALCAIEKFVQCDCLSGLRVLMKYNQWLLEDGVIEGEEIDNHDLIDEELVEIR